MAAEGRADDALAMHSNTFAARAGRWSSKNRKKAIWGWLAFVAVAFVIGNVVGFKDSTNDQSYVGESGKADKLSDDHFPDEVTESVIVSANKGDRKSVV